MSATRTLFVNAVSAVVGGGLNDLVNTLPLLESSLADHGWQMRTWVSSKGADALQRAGASLRNVHLRSIGSVLDRGLWEFVQFPSLVRREPGCVVLQFSNFVVRRMPARQVVVLRSPTFFATEYRPREKGALYQRFRYHAGVAMSRRTLRLADHVFCISATHKEQVRQLVGDAADAVRVSYLGVSQPAAESEQALVERLPPHQREMLEAIEWRAGAPIVLNVASYYVHKNLLTLLKAVELLAAAGRRLRLVLTAGILDGPEPADSTAREERALARKLSAGGLLLDLGPVERSLAWRLYRSADVFAFTSSVESFGHPLLEAMTAGVPVVASDTPIHREIAGNAAEFCGLYDPQGLAAALARVLDEKEVAERLRQRGRDRASGFTWARHAESLATCIMHA